MPTYSLTLRTSIDRKLTSREVDDNFLYLQNLALSGGGGGLFSSDTYTNWNIARLNGTLPQGQYVKITDKADAGVLLYCSATNSFAIEGTGCFMNADYQGIGDYSTVEDFNSCQGQRVTSSETSIVNGDVVIWDNDHYLVTDSDEFNANNPADNPSAYFLLTDITDGYIFEWDVIIYDFNNDVIKWRIDKRGNKISLWNCSFQWGDDKIRSIGMSTYESYISIENNSGYINGSLSGLNSAVVVYYNSNTVFFDIDGTQVTLNTQHNSGNIECHIEGFNSGLNTTVNSGDIKVYIYDSSYVSASNNSGTIYANYQGNSQIYHNENNRDILYTEFINSYIHSVSTLYLKHCNITGLGNYDDFIDFEGISGTWSGKYYTPYESTFNYVIDNTYLQTGLSPSVPNEFDFYLLDIPSNLSFVGEFSLNLDQEYNIDKISGTREGFKVRFETLNYDFSIFTVDDSVVQDSSVLQIGGGAISLNDSYNNYAVFPVQYWSNTGVSSFIELQRKTSNLSINRVTNYGGRIERTLPTIITMEVTDITYNFAMSGGIVLNEGAADVTERGVCINTTGYPDINDPKTSDGAGIGSFTSSITGLSPGQTYYLRAYAINEAGAGYGAQKVLQADLCLAAGTMILLSNYSYKAIEDVDYEDTLLVWNFDDGKFDISKPIWIKKPQVTNKYNLLTFSDGTILKTISQHRIFNKEKGMFTYPMTDETPVGTTTFNSFGKEVTLISKEVISERVEYYNIITDRHINLFANDILTSCRYNNIYPMVDMKFVKDNRQLRSREEFVNIPDNYVDGLRLTEQTIPLVEIEIYVNNLKNKEVVYEIS